MCVAFLPFITMQMTMKVFAHAYLLQIIYALLFVFLVKYLVDLLRNAEQIDAYDYMII